MSTSSSFRHLLTLSMAVALVIASIFYGASFSAFKAHASNGSLSVKVDSVNGNKPFEVKSFSWEVTNKNINNGGGGGGGKATAGDFQLLLKTNQFSADFLKKVGSGEHMKKITIEAADDDHVSTWDLTDALFTSYKVSGTDVDGTPIDQLMINFAQIEFSMDGSQKKGWNFKKNASI